MNPTYVRLMSDANFHLSERYWPEPTAILEVPVYYKDPVGSAKAKAALEVDSTAAFALAVAYRITGAQAYREKAAIVLDAWAKTNQGTRGTEARLVLGYKGQRFVHAAMLMGHRSPDFQAWVTNVFENQCSILTERWNNWGSWGWHGRALALRYMLAETASTFGGWGAYESFRQEMEGHVIDHLERSLLRVPFVSAGDGELWTENLRSTYGMKYTYFFLAPLLQASFFLDSVNLRARMIPALDRLWQWTNRPQDWPYLGWKTKPLRELQKLLFPCEDQILYPSAESWPANLFRVAGSVMDRSDWLEYGKRYPCHVGINLFRYADLWENWSQGFPFAERYESGGA